jgi:hypothetical protein
MRTFWLLLSLVSFCGVAAAQGEMPPAKVEGVYFYGLGGRDGETLKAALPFRVGERFSDPIGLIETRPRVEETVKRVTGLTAADVSYVSPGGETWFVYVGVAGGSVKPFRYNEPPKGTARLAEDAIALIKAADEAFLNAMRRGNVREDDSQGYALSVDDQELRAKQMAMREWAVRNEAAIVSVLRSSGDVKHRQAASQLLGYAKQSPRQIAELVRASRDEDETVRNNATRALLVIANSNETAAATIPADGFVEMLNSGEWTDRNKAAGLLLQLTKTRPPRLLAAIRSSSLESLIEMATWANDHAQAARTLLGRIAGIWESELEAMVADDRRAAAIVDAAKRVK